MDRRLVGVDVAERVDQPRGLADVLEHRVAVLPGARVDDHDALVEVGEVDASRLEDDVHLRVAAAEVVLGRRRADGVLDEVRRDAHHARLAVDDAAAVAVDVERVVGLDPHPRALEHLERAEMDVVELGLREHAQAEPARAGPPGVQVSLHWSTSAMEPRPPARPPRGPDGAGAAAPAGLEPMGGRRASKASPPRAPNFAEQSGAAAEPGLRSSPRFRPLRIAAAGGIVLGSGRSSAPAAARPVDAAGGDHAADRP